PLGLDLLVGGLREVMGLHGELLGELTGAEDAHAVAWSVGEASLLEGVGIDGIAVLERLVEVADVDHVILLIPGFVGEAALGDAAKERHLAAFEGPLKAFGAGA